MRDGFRSLQAKIAEEERAGFHPTQSELMMSERYREMMAQIRTEMNALAHYADQSIVAQQTQALVDAEADVAGDGLTLSLLIRAGVSGSGFGIGGAVRHGDSSGWIAPAGNAAELRRRRVGWYRENSYNRHNHRDRVDSHRKDDAR